MRRTSVASAAAIPGGPEEHRVEDVAADPVVEGPVPRGEPRPQEGLALPELAARLGAVGVGEVVAREALVARDQRPLVAGRAQPRVDLVERPLPERHLEEGEEALREAGVEDVGRGLPGGVDHARLGGRVEEDEVEIGVVAELAPAELPERHHREASGRHPTLRPRLLLGQLERGPEERLGQVGELLGHARQPDAPGDVVHGDAQDLLVLHPAQLGQLPLHGLVDGSPGRHGGEPGRDLLAEDGQALLQDHLVVSEQLVDQLGVAEEALGEEVGGAEEGDQLAEDARRVAQEPEVGLGGLEGGRELGEMGDGLAGVGGGHDLDEERHGGGRVPHAREGGRTPGQRVQGGQRLVRVVEAAAQGDLPATLGLHLLVGEERQLRVQRRRTGRRPEETREQGGDAIAVAGQGGLEPLHVGVPHGPGQAEPLLGRGKAVGLAAVHHLDPVLGPPQEQVGVGDGVAVARLHDAGEEQAVERPQHRPLPDARVAQLASVEQLQRRDEELRLPDPSPAELEVVLALGARAGVDAGLHGLDLLDDPQVERAAPDEGLELAEQLLAHRQVAGAGARLHQGVALPGPAEGLVVELGRPDAVHDGSAAPVGPEVQVHPEDHPVLGDPGEALGDELGEPGEVGEVGEGALAGRRPVGRVDVDEVDVRGEVELPGAQLSHGDGAEAGAGGPVLEPRGRPVPRAEPPVVEGDGGVERRRGEGGERAGDLVDAGAAQVAQRDAHQLPGREAPQEPVQPVDVLRIEPPGGASQRGPHGGLGALPPHPGRPGGAAQEPGVAGQGLRGQPGRPGEEHQGLDQVASPGELGDVEESFHAGERQVGVGSHPAELDDLWRGRSQAAPQAGDPVRGVRRAERGGGDSESGDERFAGHVRPASAASRRGGRRPAAPA